MILRVRMWISPRAIAPSHLRRLAGAYSFSAIDTSDVETFSGRFPVVNGERLTLSSKTAVGSDGKKSARTAASHLAKVESARVVDAQKQPVKMDKNTSLILPQSYKD